MLFSAPASAAYDVVPDAITTDNRPYGGIATFIAYGDKYTIDDIDIDGHKAVGWIEYRPVTSLIWHKLPTIYSSGPKVKKVIDIPEGAAVKLHACLRKVGTTKNIHCNWTFGYNRN